MTIEIAIGKSLYKIECEEKEKEKLLQIAKIINRKINLLTMKMRNIDEKTLLVMTSLMIQEELEQEKENNNKNLDKISDDDMYDAMRENVENITSYIKRLTKRIKDY